MINKSIVLLLLVTAIYIRPSCQTLDVSQTLSQFVPASPEASAIASYQSYPIDYMTGSPNISIPLFDLTTKLGKIPFSLSYHIGRIKTSELNGPVGFGWTLMPNLGITRSVKGVPDGPSSGYPASNVDYGNYSSCQYLLNLSRNYGPDEQPDNFYYSLLGKSGSFVYKRNLTFSTIPFDPVQISHPTDNSFILTDVDGTIYKFGLYSSGSSTCLEYTNSNAPILTGWKVTEIISYDKTDTLKFVYNPTVKQWDIPYYDQEYKMIEYPYRTDLHTQIYRTTSQTTIGWSAQRPGSFSQTTPTDPISVFDVLPTVTHAGDHLYSPGSFPLTCGLNYGADYSDPNTLQDHYVDEMQLTDILFRGGKVSMTYDSTQLKSITLYKYANSVYTQVKKMSLYQHRLTTGSGEEYQPVVHYNNINYRSLLDSVMLMGNDTVTQEKYKLAYTPDANGANVGSLAVAAGFDADMFGFPIGNSNFTIPSIPLNMSYQYCQITTGTNGQSTGVVVNASGVVNVGSKQFVAPAGPAMPSGVLQTITYPTGGTATLQFERNIFKMKDVSAAVAGGGFRIAQIKYKTITGADSIVKTYHYGSGEGGYGIIKYAPSEQDFMSQQYVNTTSISSTAAPNIVQKITMINASPFKDLVFDNAAAVFYPAVTEYITSPSGNVGKIVYSYTITALNETRLPMTRLQYDYRDGWRTSQLSAVEKYGFKNNAYAIAERTQYSYTDIIKDTVPVAMAYQRVASQVPASNEDQLLCASSTNGSAATYISYKLLPGAKVKQQETETHFDPDDSTQFVQTIKTYDYDPATLQMTGETEVNSKNQTRQIKTWYPNNAAQLPDWPAAQLSYLTALQAANRIGISIKKQTLVNAAPMVTVQDYFMTADNSQIYPGQTWSGIRNNLLENRVQVNKYDQYGNVLEQQRANDVKEVYLWGYNGLYPVAKITNVDYATASALIIQSTLDNPATTDAQMRTELNKLRTGLTHSLVFTYTYSPFVGITSQTDPAGLITYYEYDKFGRLLLIRDNNNNIIKTFEYHYRGQ